MSLAARRSTRLREDFVIRLGCLLVSFAVLASLILEPPRAKAFALTSSAVTALAGGFLNACGLAPVVSGMSSSGEVNESLARLLQDFLNEEVGGISVADWALSFGEIGLAVKDKKIVIPKPFAEKLGEFASWVAGKYGTQAGVSEIYSGSYFKLADGTRINLSHFKYSGGAVPASLGSFLQFPSSFPICFSTGYSYVLHDYSTSTYPYSFILRSPDGELNGNRLVQVAEHGVVFFGFCDWLQKNSFGIFFKGSETETYRYLAGFTDSDVEKYFGYKVGFNESLSLDVSDTMQQVLDRLTALEEGQSIALDVGATQSMEIQEIFQGILDAILAGDLSASAEIVDEAVEPVDPPAGELPDVDGLGLPALGAALTSRFPFSIPWDVYKGVTLLAAPPKAPYFEVDFMAPIADRVGGWQGSTKIVLDFSEYEIIGQVCRWTSTIGFCLMLATGTKRLIWTA